VTPPLAHTGHWLVNLLYVAPVVVIVATLAVQARRDRRRAAAGDAGGPGTDDG
jgi:hypothetical protein